MRRYFVYVLASQSHVLYIGVTNDVVQRVDQHRRSRDTFTARYRVHRLVYIEETRDVRAAIQREKQIKGWTRTRKVALIESASPRWIDLLAVEPATTTADPSLRRAPT